MRSMLKSVADLVNTEEEVRADWMVTLNAYEVGFSVTSEEVACVDGAELVDLRVDFGFNNASEGHDLS